MTTAAAILCEAAAKRSAVFSTLSAAYNNLWAYRCFLNVNFRAQNWLHSQGGRGITLSKPVARSWLSVSSCMCKKTDTFLFFICTLN